jgi:hypothetical protein
MKPSHYLVLIGQQRLDASGFGPGSVAREFQIVRIDHREQLAFADRCAGARQDLGHAARHFRGHGRIDRALYTADGLLDNFDILLQRLGDGDQCAWPCRRLG